MNDTVVTCVSKAVASAWTTAPAHSRNPMHCIVTPTVEMFQIVNALIASCGCVYVAQLDDMIREIEGRRASVTVEMRAA